MLRLNELKINTLVNGPKSWVVTIVIVLCRYMIIRLSLKIYAIESMKKYENLFAVFCSYF